MTKFRVKRGFTSLGALLVLAVLLFAGKVAAQEETLAEFAVGDGPGALGVAGGAQDVLERTPQAIAVQADGTIVILDDVNNRLVSVAPNRTRTITDLPQGTSAMALAARENTLFVIDGRQNSLIAVADGQVQETFALNATTFGNSALSLGVRRGLEPSADFSAEPAEAEIQTIEISQGYATTAKRTEQVARGAPPKINFGESFMRMSDTQVRLVLAGVLSALEIDRVPGDTANTYLATALIIGASKDGNTYSVLVEEVDRDADFARVRTSVRKYKRANASQAFALSGIAPVSPSGGTVVATLAPLNGIVELVPTDANADEPTGFALKAKAFLKPDTAALAKLQWAREPVGKHTKGQLAEALVLKEKFKLSCPNGLAAEKIQAATFSRVRAEAQRYFNVKFTLREEHTKRNGVDEICPPPLAQKVWTLPGQLRVNGKPRLNEEITGMPYAWGGNDSVDKFSTRIDATGGSAYLAGNVCTCRDTATETCSKLVSHTATAGVDCSGFVTQLYQLNDAKVADHSSGKFGTVNLWSVAVPITWGELQPGDLLLRRGRHVMVFAGLDPNSNLSLLTYESRIGCKGSQGEEGACFNRMTVSQAIGFRPVRPVNLCPE